MTVRAVLTGFLTFAAAASGCASTIFSKLARTVEIPVR